MDPQNQASQPEVAAVPQTSPAEEQNIFDNYQPESQPEAVASTNPLAILFGSLAKPFSTIHQHMKELGAPKNALPLLGITTLIGTVFYIITTIFNTVYQKDCFFGKCEVEIDFDYLEYLEWSKVIFYPIIGYLVIIALMAGIFFVASRIMGAKHTNYLRMLAIFSVAVLPILIGSLASTFLGAVSFNLSALVLMVTMAYAWYIAYENINEETKLTGDKRIYMHTISVLFLMVVAYLAMKFILKIDMDDVLSFI